MKTATASVPVLPIIKRNEATGDAYIAQAVQEKNLRYLSYFLHAYEHRLNAKVYFPPQERNGYLRSGTISGHEACLAGSDPEEAAQFRPVQRCQVIRLFCGYLKVLVPPSNNPFEPPRVAKGITH